MLRIKVCACKLGSLVMLFDTVYIASIENSFIKVGFNLNLIMYLIENIFSIGA